eukprot:1243971-Alexandrium_andersonii.AAC.1
MMHRGGSSARQSPGGGDRSSGRSGAGTRGRSSARRGSWGSWPGALHDEVLGLAAEALRKE